LFGAVQTPFTALAARLLLNYPAQSSERDSESNDVLFPVKGLATIPVQGATAWEAVDFSCDGWEAVIP